VLLKRVLLRLHGFTDWRPRKQSGSKVYKNLLLQIRPAFGGNIIATIINYDRWPQMATVREGVMPMPTPDVNAKARLSRKKFHSAERFAD
jgi:electron transfer flavoprotein alpha subunit